MPVPGAIPAPLPRRLLAFVIDAVAALLLGGAFVVVGLVEVLGGDRPGPLPAVGAAVLLVVGAVQWGLLATGGATIGRRLTGIRLVRVPDGGLPGLGRAAVRLLVPVVAWLVPVVGPVLLHTSPLTDVRRRGWHDRAAGLMAVDVVDGVDPVTAATAARRLDDVLRSGSPAAVGLVTSADAASEAPDAPDAPDVPDALDTPDAAARDGVPDPTTDVAPSADAPAEALTDVPATVSVAMLAAAVPVAAAPDADEPGSDLTGASVPRPQPSPEPVTAVPWQVRRETPGPATPAPAAALVDAGPYVPLPAPRTEPAPLVTRAPVARPASALLDLEDTAGGAVGRHVAQPADGTPGPGADPAPPDVPADGVDVTDTAGRPVTRVVPPAAAPVHTSTSFASTQAEEDVESTRLRPARGKVPELRDRGGDAVTVVLTDGQRVTITGTALVGRNPSPRPGERPDRLIRVADPGRSVSKTHLLLGVDRGGLWLKDRDSTNGTVVTLADGQQILCGAEQQVRLPAGATVAFGDYGLSVEPDDD